MDVAAHIFYGGDYPHQAGYDLAAGDWDDDGLNDLFISEPLYGGTSEHRFMDLLLGKGGRDPYIIVREYWLAQHGESGFELDIDTTEVAYAFEAPLAFFLDARNRKQVERELHGSTVTMVEYHFEGQRIWGATAFIIEKFLKVISKQ